MAKLALEIDVKVDGKTASLKLTDSEVLTGHSICVKNASKSVIAMKKGKSGALFFSNEAHAANAQQRHNFEYAFTIEAKTLAEKAEPILEEIKKAASKKTDDSGKPTDNKGSFIGKLTGGN